MKTRPIDYRVSQKIIHWLMAILIMLDLFVAQKFGGEMMTADRIASRSDHSSMGLIITILFVLRIFLRLKHGAPPLPTDLPAWHKLGAKLGHLGLYLLIGSLIITGMLSAVNANSAVEPFGLFAYGDGQGSEAFFTKVRWFHELTTKLIIGLIVIHILAAFHHILRKDGVGINMLKFWTREKNS